MAMFLQHVAKIFMFLCAVICTLAAAVETTMMGYLLAILAIVFLYVGCVKKGLGLPQISRVSGKLIVVLIIVGGGGINCTRRSSCTSILGCRYNFSCCGATDPRRACLR